MIDWIVLGLLFVTCLFATLYGTSYDDGSGAMVIVEPREHPMLRTVIAQFDKAVPKEWPLYVFHGTRNGCYARFACEGLKNRRVILRNLGVENLDANTYNRLLQTRQFWDQIDGEHVLVFQTDSVPCGIPLDLNRFGKFGYIGCAYPKHAVGKNTGFWGDHSFYGSGGLSLRRKSFVLRCIEQTGSDQPEDVAFSDCVDSLDLPKPTADDLADFCAQNAFGTGRPRSWGAHQIGKQMPSNLRNQFVGYCPQAAAI